MVRSCAFLGAQNIVLQHCLLTILSYLHDVCLDHLQHSQTFSNHMGFFFFFVNVGWGPGGREGVVRGAPTHNRIVIDVS